jgi:hypothetical protein
VIYMVWEIPLEKKGRLAMNFSLKGSITLVMIVVVVLFAGCTGSDHPEPSVPSPQITTTMAKTTAIPAATTALKTATTIAITATENPVRVFGADYKWVNYRKNITQTLPPNPRYQWEYDIMTERSAGNYAGTPAIHYTITETLDYPEWVGDKLTKTPKGWIIVTDRYFDASTNKFLGGTTTERIKGTAKPATVLPAGEPYSREDRPSYEMGITPFGEMNITLTYKGTESVTVPAGTYPAARKYTGNFRDGTPITFWVASGIPVPVQYQFPNKYLDGENPFQSYELKGWG